MSLFAPVSNLTIYLSFLFIYGSAAKSCFAGNLLDRMTDMMGIIILKF